MSDKIAAAPGTQDFLGLELTKRKYIQTCFSQVMQSYNIQEVQTSILEKVETFQKNLGESSDIVQKEMFFLGEDLVLRPEGTAGVVRALVSNGWQELLPLKLAYQGSMFRKERPQKGRFREFGQLGVEMLGFNSTWGDGQAIQSAYSFLEKLGIINKVELEYNFLGEDVERLAYRQALVEYFSQYQDKLSLESQQRLVVNPLRILDSKQKEDQEFIKQAPELASYYSDSTKKEVEAFQNILSKLGIKAKYNSRLVRGLDYYNGLVFEFVSSEIGAQSTVLAGGRYDKLVEKMGGPDTPSIGWAAGIERLSYLVDLPQEAESILVGIVLVDNAFVPEALALSQKLSQRGFRVEIATNESMGKKMKRLNKLKANFAVIIGEDEIKNDSFTVKDMATGTQSSGSSLEELIEKLNA